MNYDEKLWTRLVTPAFILSPIRSGSTLLRCILNSHSLVCAPHELHLSDLKVGSTSEYLEMSLEALRLDCEHLKYLLWDRIYHAILKSSGKKILVDKSPGYVLNWGDLRAIWPKARFIILRRDPAAIVRSIVEARDGRREAEAVQQVCHWVDALEEARKAIPDNFSLSYEALMSNPADIVSDLCAFLGVSFEETMLDYGKYDHGPFVYGIGDWGDKIKSGHLHQPNLIRASVADWPNLSQACKLWNYPE